MSRIKQLPVQRKRLVSGDVAFGDVGLERKTFQDLINSVFDMRLWEQLKTLTNTYKTSILILEGLPPIQSMDRLLKGVLTTLYLYWKIPIIYTNNIYETSKWIELLFLKYGTHKANRPLPAPVKKHKDVQQIKLEMLQCIPRIGPALAQAILKQYPDLFKKEINFKYKIKGLSDISEQLLKKVFE